MIPEVEKGFAFVKDAPKRMMVPGLGLVVVAEMNLRQAEIIAKHHPDVLRKKPAKKVQAENPDA